MGELVKLEPRLKQTRFVLDRPRRMSGLAPVGVHSPLIAECVELLMRQFNRATGEPLTEEDCETVRNLIAPLAAMSPGENGLWPLLERCLDRKCVHWPEIVEACDKRRPGSYCRMRRWIRERSEALGYPNDPDLEPVVFFVAIWLIPPEMMRPMGTTDLLPPQTLCRLSRRA